MTKVLIKKRYLNGNVKHFLFLTGLIIITLVGFSSPVVQINAQSTTSYQLLAPLPQLCPNGSLSTDNCTVSTTGGLGAYLNPMIKIFIALCAVLSVIMIVVGGIEYMTSELAHSKEAGKERIWQAILGLLIALGSWALLNTINPDLLNSEFNPGAVNATVPTKKSIEQQIKDFEDVGDKTQADLLRNQLKEANQPSIQPDTGSNIPPDQLPDDTNPEKGG